MAGIITPRISTFFRPDNGLVGLWPASVSQVVSFSFSTVIQDASGLNNPLVGVGVSINPSPYGLDIAPASASFTVSTTNPAFLTPSLTYAAWINPSSIGSTNRTIFGGGSPNPILFLTTAGIPTFTKNGAGNFAVSSVAAAASRWMHVAGTYSSATGLWSVYVNGILTGSGTSAQTWATTGTVGVGAASFLWAGKVADVRVYQRAITGAEVYAIYAGAIQTTDIIEPMALFRPSGGSVSVPIFGAPSATSVRAPAETVSIFV